MGSDYQVFILLLLLGGMLFFPAVVAPAIFSSLEEKYSGALLRRLFPNYYLFIIALSLIAGLLGDLSSLTTGTCVFILVTTVFVRQILMPKINNWRDEELDGNSDSGRKFARSHRFTVYLNLLQIVLIIYSVLAKIDLV